MVFFLISRDWSRTQLKANYLRIDGTYILIAHFSLAWIYIEMRLTSFYLYCVKWKIGF